MAEVVAPTLPTLAPAPSRDLPTSSQLSDAPHEEEPARVPGKAHASPRPNGHAGKGKGGAKSDTASMYAGNKLAAIKKEDGQPLMKKDIQYDFLRAVFHDETAVFSSSYDPSKPKSSFADVYIEAMARSERTSNVLREKLSSERESAVSMAMICLLVNLGRMNTTLNFFPEMRAQLRTYHAIPSLQAKNDPNAYKALQDAPRLKSILKGSCNPIDGVESQPSTLEILEARPRPRCNPIALVFTLAQHAPIISERHFKKSLDFFDLVMRHTLDSKSRARAFLWIMWWYLESDFSDADAQANPFGPADTPEDQTDHGPYVPALVYLTEEQAATENVDTQEEIEYGEMKRLERLHFSEQEAMHHYQITKRGPKKIGHPLPAMESGMHVIANPKGTVLSSKRKYSAVDGGQSPSSSLGAGEPPPKRTFSGVRNHSEALSLDPSSMIESSDIPSLRAGHSAPRLLSSSRPESPSGTPFMNAGDILSLGQLPSGASANTMAKLFRADNDDDLEKPNGTTSGKKRQPNSHQRAVQANREQQVEYILVQDLLKARKELKTQRKASQKPEDELVRRTWRRLEAQEEWWEDSEDDGPENWPGLVAAATNKAENEGLGALFSPARARGLKGYWNLSREERKVLAEVKEGAESRDRRWASGGREPGWAGVVRRNEEDEDWGMEADLLEQGARRLWRRTKRWMGAEDDRVGEEIREEIARGVGDASFDSENPDEEGGGGGDETMADATPRLNGKESVSERGEEGVVSARAEDAIKSTTRKGKGRKSNGEKGGE